jgi:signal transduction histidine kinase/HAMP domain-containing protein
MTDLPNPERGRVRQFLPDIPFRVLLTTSFMAIAVVPVGLFGVVILLSDLAADEAVVGTLLMGFVVGSAMLGLVVAAYAIAHLTEPLRRIAIAVERVAAGEPSSPIHIPGDDELSRLADSHNRISTEAHRRNRELADLLAAIAVYSPAGGTTALRDRAQADGCKIFGLIDCQLAMVDPASIPVEERIPGDPRPVRAEVRAGIERLGLLVGHLPATRDWERADQDLLDLFASEVGVAMRNAELFGQIEDQNSQLVALDATKDEFLRGVSHNLQTPLTSIRAYVDQIRTTSAPDEATEHKLQIVAEQTERLTRLVRQLLTVTRIEAGAIHSEPEIIAMGSRVRRAWEALNVASAQMTVSDEARGWLALADPDQLDQVLWALLDNAVKYGGRDGHIEVAIRADERKGTLITTIADHGPGVSRADRARLFGRFSRGAAHTSGDGSGLGLYVSRQLLRQMGGDLELEPARKGLGAAFAISLPAEPPATAE